MQDDHIYKPITIGDAHFKQMTVEDVIQLQKYYNGLKRFILSDEFYKYNHQIRTRLIIESKFIKKRLKKYID